jgi:hypothetical protein
LHRAGLGAETVADLYHHWWAPQVVERRSSGRSLLAVDGGAQSSKACDGRLDHAGYAPNFAPCCGSFLLKRQPARFSEKRRICMPKRRCQQRWRAWQPSQADLAGKYIAGVNADQDSSSAHVEPVQPDDVVEEHDP